MKLNVTKIYKLRNSSGYSSQIHRVHFHEKATQLPIRTNNYLAYRSRILETSRIFCAETITSPTSVSSNRRTNVAYATSFPGGRRHHSILPSEQRPNLNARRTHIPRTDKVPLERAGAWGRGFRKRERDSSGFGSRSAAVERGRADSRTILGRRAVLRPVCLLSVTRSVPSTVRILDASFEIVQVSASRCHPESRAVSF